MWCWRTFDVVMLEAGTDNGAGPSTGKEVSFTCILLP